MKKYIIDSEAQSILTGMLAFINFVLIVGVAGGIENDTLGIKEGFMLMIACTIVTYVIWIILSLVCTMISKIVMKYN